MSNCVNKETCIEYARLGENTESYLCPDDTAPMSNADRIRAMDDKELAEFIDRCEAAGYNDSSVALDKNNNLMDTLDWLQQPAEEEQT